MEKAVPEMSLRGVSAPVAVDGINMPKTKIVWCGLRLATRKIRGATIRQYPQLIGQAAPRLVASPSDR